MVVDLSSIKSHPDRTLMSTEAGLGHTEGVVENVRMLTMSKWAELIAIFHDLGKINPNFQDKLLGESEKYANHAYLSAYAFYCAFCCIKENLQELVKCVGSIVSSNDIIAAVVSIAKHHGNLPDFSPVNESGGINSILSQQEIRDLYKFIQSDINHLPIDEFAKSYFEVESFKKKMVEEKVQKIFLEQFKFIEKQNVSPLDFFLNTQFSFACLLLADKTDAAQYNQYIHTSRNNVEEFCSHFLKDLLDYLAGLNQETELNRLRTEIRNTALSNIAIGLNQVQRVFELTSPTGSGKTLMLLSLTSEIIKEKGAFRIIYALPFLSITEQVEAEVQKIFKSCNQFIQRIDSKSQDNRFEALQEDLDKNPSKDKYKEVEQIEFQEKTFSYPFIITTFVRLFETLLSNTNAELLKLPNFSNTIFLIDEIQALPPRLYGFFVAYLNAFCSKFNSYAIISTATQPNFILPEKTSIKSFFPEYTQPYPLLPLSFFEHHLFNRYSIDIRTKESWPIETLKEQILQENQSVLIVLNTIDDTKELYRLLSGELNKHELLLLNTHITPRHRRLKIYLAKRRLREGEKIVLVSTQLIEAGVDIDFPVLYRDLATIPSIIQSAGRCNRNGKQKQKGKVVLFNLCKNGRSRAELIYRGKDEDILKFTKESLLDDFYQENTLINIQKHFFDRIQLELNWGMHSQNSPAIEFDFLKDIKDCQFEKIGKFQLIDKQVYGKEMTFYVSKEVMKFEHLLSLKNGLIVLLKNEAKQDEIRNQKRKIAIQLRKMSQDVIQVRLKKNHQLPILANNEDYYGLFCLSPKSYSFDDGVDLKGEECIL